MTIRIPSTVLQVSKIAGVGCFSTLDIPKGCKMFHLQNGLSIRVSDERMEDLMLGNPQLEHWVKRFGSHEGGAWFIPRDFEEMHNLCRVNHSVNPSMGYEKAHGGVWFPVAMVDIVAYETELTHDYYAIQNEGVTFFMGPDRPQ